MDLDAYRGSAESFISELTGAYYRHYAGLEAEYEIEPIYGRHASLFTPDAVSRLRDHADAAPSGTDQQRRARMLVDFAIEGNLGQATKALDAELARREGAMSIEIEGVRIGFRESAVLQANEPRGEMRELVEQARLELTERELGPLYRELIELQHETVSELGYRSYRQMCEQCKALDLDGLAQQTDFFTAETDTVYEPMLEPELRRSLGIGVAQLRRADVPRFFRAPDQDRWFPAQRLVPSLIESHRWLELHLGIEDTAELVLHARAQRLIYLRRYAAKLRYELELHGGRRPLDELPRRYAQLLGSALRIDWPQQTYLADVDPGFYSACYLRAWALEAHLRNYLEQRFGQEWFTKLEAGHTLKQLWSQGQRLTAEELLQELTNEQLDFSILLRDLQLGKPDRT
jgi:hypothetical protein